MTALARKILLTAWRVAYSTFRPAMFALGLAALFIGGVRTARYLGDADSYSYPMTAAALDATRARLDRALFALLPRASSDRRADWAELVGEALAQGDVDLAEAYLEAAPAMLGAPDIDAIAALPEDVRAHYLDATSDAAVALRAAGQAAEGFAWGRPESWPGLAGAVTADFLVWGDIRDFARESWRAARGEEVDEFIYVLSGIGLGLTAATIASEGAAAPVKGGASVLKAAKRTGALSEPFARSLPRRTGGLLDMPVLRRRLGDAADCVSLDRLASGDSFADLAGAWRAAFDRRAAKALMKDIGGVSRISAAMGTRGAVKAMRHVEGPADLAQLEIIARAGGKRAVVAERHMGKRMLGLARGTLKTGAKLGWSLAGLVGGLLLAIASLVGAGLEWGAGRAVRGTRWPARLDARVTRWLAG